MKLKYCLTGLLCFFIKANAQQIKPVSIGGKVPDVQIKNILNYSALQSNLTDFKNKLLILDFMATTCSGCIKSLPSLDSLQKKFGDKIQIVLVSYESREKVKPFLKRHNQMKFPIIYSDSILSQLFPHTFIPHDVWINKGVVKAVTYPEYVNAKNINAVVANETISWPVKFDIAEFDYTQPLIHSNEQNVPPSGVPSVMYYGLFSTHMENIPPMYKVQTDSSKQSIRTYMINMSIIDIYLRSYGLFHWPQSRLVLEVQDTGRYVFDKNKIYHEEWKKQNTFCYESVVSTAIPLLTRQQKIRNDVDMFAGMHCRIEHRNVKCLVLVQVDSIAILKPVYSTRSITNMTSLSNIIYTLDQTLSGVPALDESGLPPHAWINLNESDIANMPLLQQTLKKYGLQLLTQERQIDVLILSENNYQINNLKIK